MLFRSKRRQYQGRHYKSSALPALRRTHDCSCHHEQDVALLRPCQTDGQQKRSNVASAHREEKIGRLTPQRAQRRSKQLLSLQAERCAPAYDKFEEGSAHRKWSLVGCTSSALYASPETSLALRGPARDDPRSGYSECFRQTIPMNMSS